MEKIMSKLSTAGSAWLLLALGALAAAGCASTGAASQHVSAPLPGTEACVFLSTVNDWEVLDSTTMIVYAPLRKDPYLLKLFAPVIDLNFKERVGFEDSAHTGQLCGNGLDYLVIRGDIPQRMPIVAFRKLTVDQAKQLVGAAKRPAGAAAASAPATAQPPPAPPQGGKN
jgi:hypothetical protein